MTRPANLLEIGHIRRAHGVHGQVSVELGTDRLERVQPGTRWYARDGWLTVVSAARHQARWLVTIEGVGDREAAQRWTNTPIYAEPIDDPEALWVHELIGSSVVEITGRERGRCISVVANPASDLLELESGALVPVVFVVRHEDDLVVIDPPLGLFDDDGEEVTALAPDRSSGVPKTGVGSASEQPDASGASPDHGSASEQPDASGASQNHGLESAEDTLMS